MKIIDAFILQDTYWVACTGVGMTRDFACKAIVVNGKQYKVKRCEVRNSFSNHMQALMEIEGTELPELGTCEFEE